MGPVDSVGVAPMTAKTSSTTELATGRDGSAMTHGALAALTLQIIEPVGNDPPPRFTCYNARRPAVTAAAATTTTMNGALRHTRIPATASPASRSSITNEVPLATVNCTITAQMTAAGISPAALESTGRRSSAGPSKNMPASR